MSNARKIDELITYSRVLYERKPIHATGGNTSVKDGDCVLISQTGAKLGELTEAQRATIDKAMGRSWE